MKKYIKPSVNVVELSAKESIAALTFGDPTKTTAEFGFGSNGSKFTNLTRTIAVLQSSGNAEA